MDRPTFHSMFLLFLIAATFLSAFLAPPHAAGAEFHTTRSPCRLRSAQLITCHAPNGRIYPTLLQLPCPNAAFRHAFDVMLRLHDIEYWHLLLHAVEANGDE